MRAALMDLDFAGLIEKIEERFGRDVTTVLLVALCLVECAWAVRTAVDILAATYDVLEKGGWKSLARDSEFFSSVCDDRSYLVGNR